MKRHGQRYLPILVLLVSSLAALQVVWKFSLTSWDFRNNLWGPAYLLLHGYSPYNIELLFPHTNAIWFPMIIGAGFPLGLLDESTATKFWLMLNIALLLAIIFLVWHHQQRQLFLFGTVGVLVFIFPPTVSHLVLGQFSIIAAFCMILTVHLTKGHHESMAALCLALALSKPQLTVLFVVGISAFYVTQYGIKRSLVFAVRIFFWIALLTLPLFLAYPGWSVDLLDNLRKNQNWLQPSSLSQLRLVWGAQGVVIWAMLALIILVVNIGIWKWMDAQRATFWSLALTVLIVPYVWSWDFVLLLPLLVHLAVTLKWTKLKWALLLGYGLCWLLILRIQVSHYIGNEQFWWVPCTFIVLAAVLQILDRRPACACA